MNSFKTVKKQTPKAVLILSSLLLGTPWLSHAQLASTQQPVATEAAVNSATAPKNNSLNQVKTYTCPMHPEVLSHEPGRCPKCNMFLVEKEGTDTNSADPHAEHQHTDHLATEHAHTSTTKAASQVFDTPTPKANNLVKKTSEETTTKYICPMHAHIISDVPGTCPICGMNLEKVETGGNTHEININVSGSMQQALAIKVAKVEHDTLWKFVETVGQVDYDESQITHIHARVTGWVEKLMVKSMGDTVKKGQLLYEIYSPDLVNAQDDYLLALDTAKTASNQRYQDLVRRAGLRLSFLGFTEQQIKQLADSRQTQYRVPFYAQQDGVVETLSIRDGMYIEPSTEVMSLVDLSKVWVIADVFENEQSWIVKGQQAEVAVPAMNLSGIKGTIDYIYPELDPVTRSLRVRVVLNNTHVSLRPKTLAKVSLFGGPNKDTLVIPQEALIQTGKENRVIVKQDDNSFAAKVVTVGMMSQGKAEIVSGLTKGERVVISGQFLLDSEASLKGSLMRLSSGHQH
ncbi:MAG: efflux RND transporter periplasmic adaptor subunit [Shewanella sp.]|jgi:Cu(I)/Ag(I) efflux system membrane fusion protein|uniref:efflux RND transporter periplasmic adaptor subunit n=1 Tax=Shewanella sp. TaxID=50422 RepID=UPI003563DAF0